VNIKLLYIKVDVIGVKIFFNNDKKLIK